MLSKLIKHDFKALKRILLPLMAAIAAASLLCTVALRLVITVYTSDSPNGVMTALVTASTGLFIFINSIAILLCPTLTILVSVTHFYRSLYTDEGYLTFTLPVKRQDILASKYITTLMWGMIAVAVTIAAGSIVLLFGTTADEIINTEVVGGMKELFAEISADVFIRYLVYGVVSSLYFMSMLFLAVTIGSIVAKKHKVLAAIGFCYLINLVTSIATNAVNFFITLTAIGSDIDTLFEYVSLSTPVINSILYVGFGAAEYILCLHLMKTRLNLQ